MSRFSASQTLATASATTARRLSEDGGLLFAAHAIDALRTRFRSALLGRSLGAKGLNIRADSLIKGLAYITIGDGFDAGRGLWLEAISRYRGQAFSPRIVIGSNVSVSSWCHIASVQSVEIGNDVMMGSRVLIIDHNHGNYGVLRNDRPDTPPASRPLSAGRIVIGNKVWIGDGVVIMPGSSIGDGCVIGANAVVRGAVRPNTVAVGIPARTVKEFDFASGRWIKP